MLGVSPLPPDSSDKTEHTDRRKLWQVQHTVTVVKSRDARRFTRRNSGVTLVCLIRPYCLDRFNAEIVLSGKQFRIQ